MAVKSNPHRLFAIVIILLCLFLGLIVLKHLKLKSEWKHYSLSSQTAMVERNITSTQQQAVVIAEASTATISGKSFFLQGHDFQTYIHTLSLRLSRDIVIIDKNNTILADTISSNIGKKFNSDPNNEVQKTIADGLTRTFFEKSTDYPKGIAQTVVAMKDAAGTTLGAVVLSSDILKN